MTKLLSLLSAALLLGGCTTPDATAEKTTAQRAAAKKQQKGNPNLDRTYDWGARPPVANPAHDQD